MIEKDAILAKISTIQRCLRMIQKATQLDPASLDDLMIQDVFVLNLQRAAQACIDIAHLVISEKGLKLPTTYKEAFGILQEAQLIDASLSGKMQKMAGFRNLAIHDYQVLKVEVLKAILVKHLKDFEEFYERIFLLLNAEAPG